MAGNVRAIVEAWYPGQAGGRAIAEVLTGIVNPSGRLPITFPADLAQTPASGARRPWHAPWGTPSTIRYDEGAEVGYGGSRGRADQPLFAFGHGLSYTSFDYGDLIVERRRDGDGDVHGDQHRRPRRRRRPAALPDEGGGRARMRLLGFERVELAPGESRSVTVRPTPGCSPGTTETRASGTSREASTTSRSAGPPTTSC